MNNGIILYDKNNLKSVAMANRQYEESGRKLRRVSLQEPYHFGSADEIYIDSHTLSIEGVRGLLNSFYTKNKVNIFVYEYSESGTEKYTKAYQTEREEN